jgi:hypothetical protein
MLHKSEKNTTDNKQRQFKLLFEDATTKHSVNNLTTPLKHDCQV